MDQKFKVTLNLYDLSRGMAKVFSPMLLGKQIEGIWHTGIVIYDKEYYFGGGICQGVPKQTPYMDPIQELELGETEVTQDLFEQFLSEISSKFTMDKYDLFSNNCNNFTNECSEFLIGKGIPSYITGLPQEVLNTQIGQMLKPMIENMQNQVIQQSGNQQMFNGNNSKANEESNVNVNNGNLNQQQQQNDPALVMAQNLGAFFSNQQNLQQEYQQNPPQQPQQQQGIGINNNQAQQVQQVQQQQQQQGNQQAVDMKNVIELQGEMDFFEVLDKQKLFIVDFSAAWCPPCKMIKPIYAKYSEDYPEIKFYAIDGSQQQDLSQQFGVKSFPTFITFVDGAMKEKWEGANQIKLKEKLEQLKQQAKK